MKSPQYTKFKHYGIVTDLPPEEVPVENWTNCSNFQFEDLSSKRVGGYQTYAGTASAPPIFDIPVTVNGLPYWIYCSVNKVYVTDGTTHYNITPSGGLNTVTTGDWTGCILNGIAVLNNGSNAPFYWNSNTSSACQYLPNWKAGTTCKVIRAFKYHLIALNVFDGVRYGSTLWWSNAAVAGSVPTAWTPSTTNDAGDFSLSDTDGDIVDGLSMRDSFVVYKKSSTYVMSYVAGAYVFTQRKSFLSTGMVASNCVCEVNGNHWVFTGTDVIVHDGQSFESIVKFKVKNNLIGAIEPSLIKQCIVVPRLTQKQVWVCIPETGMTALSKAYIINIDTKECGVRTLPSIDYIGRGIVDTSGASNWASDSNTWNSDITFWDEQKYSPNADTMLMCSRATSALYAVDTISSNDGVAFYSELERLSIPMGEDVLLTRRVVERITPHIEGINGDVISISVGGQTNFDEAINWSAPQSFTIGTDKDVYFMVEGRIHSIRFYSTSVNPWKIHNYTMTHVDAGIY